MAGLGNCFPCWTEYRRAVAAVIEHLDTPMCHAHAQAEGVEVPYETPVVTIGPKPVEPETRNRGGGLLSGATMEHAAIEELRPATPAKGEKQVKKKCESSDCGQEFTPKPNQKHGYCSSRCYAREHYRKTHPKAGKGDVVSVTRVAVADPAKSPYPTLHMRALAANDEIAKIAISKTKANTLGFGLGEQPPLPGAYEVVSVTLREAVLDRLWFTLTPEQKAAAISSSLNGV